LLADAENAVKDDSSPRLAAYGVHDYTLLCLMHTLGVPQYPRPCLGFTAYMTLEFWEPSRFRLSLNPEPFPFAVHGNPTTFVAQESVLFDDVSAESLHYLLTCKASKR
jgi:hypothetical protein